MFARLHFTKDAFILQLFLQRAKGLINIILADVNFDHVSVQLSFLAIAKGLGLPARPAFEPDLVAIPRFRKGFLRLAGARKTPLSGHELL